MKNSKFWIWFIPLFLVVCIGLYNMVVIANKNKVVEVKDSEVIYDFSISLFTTPAGAFIVFGLILAVIAFIKNRKAELKANLAKQEKARKAAEAAAMAAQAQAGGSK